MSSKEVFYQTMAAIPKGHFTSYGKLAKLCGVHVRQIQAWLRTLPNDSGLPWFRVINSQRKITKHKGALVQYQRLAEEGLLPDSRGKFPAEFYWPTEYDAQK